MTDLPKTFDPSEIEARWYAHWEGSGRFRPERPDAEPFTIVIPPPNVTGSLHIGHALDLTLQDILVRHARLKGRDALWVVGTDHAGIATQMVVERRLAEQGQKRTDFTRDEFVGKVWEWKEESGGAITGQMRRLGASCDWANERFTMDPGFTRAVRKVFVDLYDRKLLYRDKRLVNWDPVLKTAISDLEVEIREVSGKFWRLKYPLADGNGFIEVATTRPKTMLADMAVAVHPDDERYQHLIGREVRLPITGRLIPIVADAHADPELGSGAVKITPGHDFNDFEVGRRIGKAAGEMLNMLDEGASIVQTADGLVPPELLGLGRTEGFDAVIALLYKEEVVLGVDDRLIQLPHGDRSGAVIEPWLTNQWYVEAAKLAQPAIAAVRDGDIHIVPETWKKTWYNWLENIQPWCVSRQLWWGHQIPAWYAPKKTDAGYMHAWVGLGQSKEESAKTRLQEPIVCESEDQIPAKLSELYGRNVSPDTIKIFDTRQSMDAFMLEVSDAVLRGEVVPLLREPDVLDTWFSSALWPFATLGWPDDTKTLRRHYPNDVLISGFDIIFFWDARMAMQGYEFMGERPWKTLYLHGLVRDAKGAKMSKSKGNTVDPLGLIDRFGADALRFTLAAMESQGRDIKLDERRIEGYRNFATKLWNAARFAQANGFGASSSLEPPVAVLPVNRWIVGETVRTVQALDLALADLRFDESANLLYHFVWDRFCDWYLELIKPVFAPDADGEGADETRAVAAWVLDQILVMLHPFMPFITEELWHAMASPACPRDHDLILARWPIADARALDAEAGPEVDWLIRLVGAIRAARTELGVPPGAKLPLHVAGADARTHERLGRNEAALKRLARVETVSLEAAPAGGAAQVVLDEAVFVLPLAGAIDIGAERARLGRALAAAEKERDALAKRLGSPGFVDKAKPEAIDKARADHAERSAEAVRIGEALGRLE